MDSKGRARWSLVRVLNNGFSPFLRFSVSLFGLRPPVCGKASLTINTERLKLSAQFSHVAVIPLYAASQKIASSKLGIFLFGLNLALLVLCVTQLRGLDIVEYEAQPLERLFFVLTLLNYIPLQLFHYIVGFYGIQSTNLSDTVGFAVASLQWLLIGFLVETNVRRIRG